VVEYLLLRATLPVQPCGKEKSMKITADLKCLSCGRVWATVQDAENTPFGDAPVRTAHPEFLPVTACRNGRCPRCHGTLLLEMAEAEEYETDLLIGV
jgi:hypothetical protein